MIKHDLQTAHLIKILTDNLWNVTAVVQWFTNVETAQKKT